MATQSDLSSPDYVTAAASGNLYIAAAGSDCVKEVAGTGHAEFTQSMTADYIYDIAGTGTAGITGDGGIGYSAEVNDPSATALDSAGDMYLADAGNNQVREVSASCGDIAVAAGTDLGGGSAGSELSGRRGPPGCCTAWDLRVTAQGPGSLRT